MLPAASAALALLASWLAAPVSVSVGDDWQQAFQQGQKLYEEKKYSESIAAYEKVVASSDAVEQAKNTAAYNIACCYALDGKKDKAVEWVVKSIDMGFDQYEHIKGDEDLKDVIGDARIAEAMKRNEAKRAERQAKIKDRMAEAEKKYEEELMKTELPKTLEKLKDTKGAGFAFDFDLKTLDGKPLTKKSLEGKVVIVDIWGTWCPPCRKEIPHFVSLMKQHEKDPFVIVGLNDEDRKQNKDAEDATKKTTKFAKDMGINYTLALIDTPTFKQVPDFEGYPTTLFLDKKGNVRLLEVGYKPLPYLDAVVNALLAEGAAAKAAAPASGEKTGEKKNP